MTKYKKESVSRRLNRIIRDATENALPEVSESSRAIRGLLLEGKSLKLKPASQIIKAAIEEQITSRYISEVPLSAIFEIPAVEKRKAEAYRVEFARLERAAKKLEKEKDKVMDKIILDGAGSEVIEEFEKLASKIVKQTK